MRRAAVALALFCLAPRPADADALAERLGVTHWDGRYNFTDRPILEEGADRIWDLGARVLKIQLEIDGKYRHEYAFNSRWGDYDTVAEAIASPNYVAAINRPWRWVNLQVFSNGQRKVPVRWCDGMTPEEIAAEREAFYQLARYLLRTYAGSGIQFLVDNWEGDNMLDRNPCTPEGGGGASWTVRDGFVKWLSARQAGILRARQEVGEHGVHVWGGAECNSTPTHVWPPGSGSQCGANVLPYLDPPPDLCGLSAYRNVGDTDMTADLAWLRERCNAKRAAPSPFGADNVYVAELGAPSAVVGDAVQLEITRAQVQSAVANRAALAVYWQLFSNECLAGCPNQPVRDGDVRGYWLVRPEPREGGGTLTPTWHWMYQALAANRTAPAPPIPGRRYRLIARTSGRCVESGRRDGPVGQRGCDADRAAQSWSLEDAPDDTVRLVARKGGDCLTAPAGEGATARASRCGKKPGQTWRLTGVVGSGAYFTLEDPRTGRCLTLSGGSYADGAPFTLSPCNQSYPQQLLFQDQGPLP